MPALVAGIHVFRVAASKTWMAGTSPAMTWRVCRSLRSLVSLELSEGIKPETLADASEHIAVYERSVAKDLRNPIANDRDHGQDVRLRRALPHRGSPARIGEQLFCNSPALLSRSPHSSWTDGADWMHRKTPDELLAANIRWSQERIAADPDYFPRLSALQAPEFLWIGCSDSRVPANVITGLEPGEVFVHRNVANIIYPADLNCMSVLQFAVETLQVKHIIVCGHYGCGGVRAVLDTRSMGLSSIGWRQSVIFSAAPAGALFPADRRGACGPCLRAQCADPGAVCLRFADCQERLGAQAGTNGPRVDLSIERWPPARSQMHLLDRRRPRSGLVQHPFLRS